MEWDEGREEAGAKAGVASQRHPEPEFKGFEGEGQVRVPRQIDGVGLWALQWTGTAWGLVTTSIHRGLAVLQALSWAPTSPAPPWEEALTFPHFASKDVWATRLGSDGIDSRRQDTLFLPRNWCQLGNTQSPRGFPLKVKVTMSWCHWASLRHIHKWMWHVICHPITDQSDKRTPLKLKDGFSLREIRKNNQVIVRI